jgi:hypothetical protein
LWKALLTQNFNRVSNCDQFKTSLLKCFWFNSFQLLKCLRDPTDLSKPGRPVSDVAEAVSQFLREEPFSSTRHIASQLRVSRTSVKRTLFSVVGMRKFSLRWVLHDLVEFQKAQRVKDSRGLLKALKVDAKK